MIRDMVKATHHVEWDYDELDYYNFHSIGIPPIFRNHQKSVCAEFLRELGSEMYDTFIISQAFTSH